MCLQEELLLVALVTLNRTKNLVPMTRLLQGWTITNGLGVVWRDGRVDQVLLDEPHMAQPDLMDVAVSRDGRRAVVVSGGADEAVVIDPGDEAALLDGARRAWEHEGTTALQDLVHENHGWSRVGPRLEAALEEIVEG